MDSFHQGPILDDEINAAIVRPLVHGAKLHALVDAHHSATVLDLPYQCVTSKSVLINLDRHLHILLHLSKPIRFLDQDYRVPELGEAAHSERRLQRHQRGQGRAHQWQQRRQEDAC
jgi:hypothetical protein